VEDLVRGYVAAFNRRDVDEMITLADPAIVNYPSVISPGSRRYVGHQGLRHWMRDVVAEGSGHSVGPREVRRLEEQQWALLGDLLLDGVPVGSFASLLGITRGLITEVREYRSEESLLQELPRL
jgi:hypothetical protein